MSQSVVDHSRVADAINDAINYTLYSAFRINERSVLPLSASPAIQQAAAAQAAAQVAALEQALAQIPGLTVRGWYDVSGFRADADVLVWLHAPTPQALQQAYKLIFAAGAGNLVPVWSNMGVHRPAEFNRGHVPAFLAGDAPRNYLCLYPFVRSYEWYLLPEGERSQLLREHGMAARDYGDVLANTVASFGLGDYEWLLAFEADDLTRIVDLMRELRATGARRHVREEVPFFTGPRVSAVEVLEPVFS